MFTTLCAQTSPAMPDPLDRTVSTTSPNTFAHLGYLLTSRQLVADTHSQPEQSRSCRTNDLAVPRNEPRPRDGRCAVDQARVPHDVGDTVEMNAHIGFLQRSVPARLGKDRHDASTGCRVADTVREWWNLSVGVRERNQLRGIESRQSLALFIELLPPH